MLRDAEQMPLARVTLEEAHVRAPHGQAICEAAVTLAERGRAAAIVAVTRGGKTAALLSALRPGTPIVAATDQAPVFRRLALLWGVLPLMADLSGDVGAAAARIGATLVAGGVISAGSAIVLVSMSPELGSGPSNFLTLQKV